MKELYRVKGYLNSGFVGQITYTVCLPYPCEEMDLAFTFSKQHYPSMEAIPPEEIAAIEEYCRREYGLVSATNQEREHAFLCDMKTEIHLMATLNDTFIGCVHKQLLERHLHYSNEHLTDGCIMPEELSGVLKVTVLAFHILMDDTPYELVVSVKEKQGGSSYV